MPPASHRAETTEAHDAASTVPPPELKKGDKGGKSTKDGKEGHGDKQGVDKGKGDKGDKGEDKKGGKKGEKEPAPVIPPGAWVLVRAVVCCVACASWVVRGLCLVCPWWEGRGGSEACCI